jgi:hypothetical protein
VVDAFAVVDVVSAVRSGSSSLLFEQALATRRSPTVSATVSLVVAAMAVSIDR